MTVARGARPVSSRRTAQGLRHDYLVRRAWRGLLRRRRVRRTAAHPTRHQPGRGRVHDRTAASIPGQEHLPPALLRMSVGIEAVEDLWTDLDRALRNVAG